MIEDDPLLSMTYEEALAFFAGVFRGESNIPGRVCKFGAGWRLFCPYDVAAFDGTTAATIAPGILTRAVLAAWRFGIQVEIQCSTPGNVNVCIWGRPDRTGRPLPGAWHGELARADDDMDVWDLRGRDRGRLTSLL
jgi:hypothetical protein